MPASPILPLAFCLVAAVSMFCSGDSTIAQFPPIGRQSEGPFPQTERLGTLAPPFHFEDLDQEFAPETSRF